MKLQNARMLLCSIICGALLLVVSLALLRPGEIRLSIHFIGYTNIVDYGSHMGVIEISNKSTFSIVRCRGPEVVFNSPEYESVRAPTGWAILNPGESERLLTEAVPFGVSWKLVILAQPLGQDSYGMLQEPKYISWQRQVTSWLGSHSIKIPFAVKACTRSFESDWIPSD